MATVTSNLTNKPLFLQALGGDTAISYTAAEVRHLLGAVFPRTGVIGASGFRITQRGAGANWSIDVAPGNFIHGSSGIETGRYLLHSDSTVNISVATFNTAPAGTRTHRVWINVYDKVVIGTEYIAKLMVTEDTGSGAPAPADSPAFQYELGQFTISPSQTSVQTAHITNAMRKAGFGTFQYDLPLATNFISGAASSNGGPPKYSLNGSIVHLSGTVARTSPTVFAPGTVYTIGTLPIGFRPKYIRYMAGIGYTGYHYRCGVYDDGTLQISVPDIAGATVPNLTWISLDGCSFEID